MLKTDLCSLQSKHYYSHEQFVTCGPLPDLNFFRSIETIFTLYIFTLLTFECSITVLAAIYCNEDFPTVCCLLRHCTLVSRGRAVNWYLPEPAIGRAQRGVCKNVRYSMYCIGAFLGAFRACWIANLPSDFVGTCTQSSLPKRARSARISEPPKNTSIPTSLLTRAVRQLFSLE